MGSKPGEYISSREELKVRKSAPEKYQALFPCNTVCRLHIYVACLFL